MDATAEESKGSVFVASQSFLNVVWALSDVQHGVYDKASGFYHIKQPVASLRSPKPAAQAECATDFGTDFWMVCQLVQGRLKRHLENLCEPRVIMVQQVKPKLMDFQKVTLGSGGPNDISWHDIRRRARALAARWKLRMDRRRAELGAARAMLRSRDRLTFRASRQPTTRALRPVAASGQRAGSEFQATVPR
jgi:hypothetical protein